jgi:hypothetical protein
VARFDAGDKRAADIVRAAGHNDPMVIAASSLLKTSRGDDIGIATKFPFLAQMGK